MLETLTRNDESALELKFYPIIPNVINTLVAEFAKRSTRVSYRAVDDYSYNEMIEQKRTQVEEVLLFEAEQKLREKLLAMGLSPEDEQFKQATSAPALKSLPEIQQFYNKDYRSMCEQWAEHQHKVDVERFHMEELEERGFRDMLITDREFWHFRMLEDDYEVETWNPVLTFYHKTPNARYVSQGNWVGMVEMGTVADMIDKYGWVMTEDQTKSLENIYPIRSALYPVEGYQNDGSFYDATRSHNWNTQMPSLGMRQYLSAWDQLNPTGDIVNYIMSESEDYFDMGSSYLLRATTVYWKSQRRVGHLTKIDESGGVIIDVVDESYKITDKPFYNTTLFKNKNRENLLFGEHIDWIWINETWGGVKIGPNRPSWFGMNNNNGFSPVYIGIDQGTPSRLKFQFKGDETLYGCKLPVEGCVFSDYNTRSTALVDLMKPFQIGYNIVNNQVSDILVDELGTVIVLDQNAIPKHSLGEDWGKGNYAKAYVAMKNFNILPLDTTLSNTESTMNFQHFQQLDLEQSKRLLSRIQLAIYFKQQAFETIGITPQRLGGEVEQATATGVRVAVSNSYAQTETYFIQHCDYLMPRVHQMRTDLAQYYNSTKPSLRLTYVTTAEDRANFKIYGTDLLLRDMNIFATTKANTRAIVEQLKQLALNSTSSSATIYDLAGVIKSESISEMDSVLKASQQKIDQQREQEMKHENELQEQQLQAAAAKDARDKAFTASQNALDRQADILGKQISAAGYGAPHDINENNQSDYLDSLNLIQKQDSFDQTMNLQSNKQNQQMKIHEDKMEINREKLQTEKQVSDNQLRIARENQTRAELQAKNKLKLDKQKAKQSKKKK